MARAEQHIKEGKQAINRMRLSWMSMAQNEVRLQLHALAYNLGVFLQGADLPKEMAERYHLAVGDEVLAVETADGILLTPYDPVVSEALKTADEAQGRYKNALRELAK